MEMTEMDDIEKSRTEYVVRLEQTLQHAQAELARYKAIAEKWEPKLHAEISPADQQARFTLEFGGKRTTATITFPAMAQTDPTTATSAIVDALIESNVAARLRDVVMPEVQRIQPSLKAMAGAGKW
jgi:hypothetical protein